MLHFKIKGLHFETNAEVTENVNLTPHLFNAIYIAFLRLKTHLHEKEYFKHAIERAFLELEEKDTLMTTVARIL